MSYFALSFLAAFIVTLLLVRFRRLHEKMTADYDMTGVQKFHARPVPRIGGAGVMAGMVVMAGYLFVSGNPDAPRFAQLLLVSLPAFLGGIVEDCTKKVPSLVRLFLTMLAAVCGFFWLNAGIHYYLLKLVSKMPLTIINPKDPTAHL